MKIGVGGICMMTANATGNIGIMRMRRGIQDDAREVGVGMMRKGNPKSKLL